MTIEIKTDQETLNTLVKYTMKSPAEIPEMMERIVREWSALVAPKWYRERGRIPRLKAIPEAKQTGVGIGEEIARPYKTWIKALGLDEAALTSWLSDTFIRTYRQIKASQETRIPKW